MEKPISGILIAALAAAMGACGSSTKSPTGPSTPPTMTPAVNNACPDSTKCPLQPPGINLFIRVFIQSGATGSATFIFAGQTLTATAARDFLFNNIAPGDYEVTGQMTGLTSLGFSLIRAANTNNSGGGGQPGSMQSLDGPMPQVGPCTVSYADFGARSTTVDTVRFKFTVNGSLGVGSTC